jgi:hypothetical protein
MCLRLAKDQISRSQGLKPKHRQQQQKQKQKQKQQKQQQQKQKQKKQQQQQNIKRGQGGAARTKKSATRSPTPPRRWGQSNARRSVDWKPQGIL